MRRRSFIQRCASALAAFANRYEAARFQPHRSIIPGAVQSMRLDANAATRLELLRLARYWERNSSLVQRIADVYETYTTGSGLKFYSTSRDPAWAAAADEYYAAWTPYADISSRQSWETLQGLCSRAQLIDGEIFIILTRGQERPGGLTYPRVQIVEGHLCSTPAHRRVDEGRSIVDGVELDGRGRPLGYHFVDEMASSRTEIVHRYIAAENVVHVFEPSRAGQYRGITMLHAVLNDLHDLDDLVQLELKACRDHAEISNIFETSGTPSSVADAIASGGDVPVVAADGKRTRYQEAAGGRTIYLDPGDKLTRWTSERPHGNTTTLWSILENRVCGGIGIPLQVVRPSSLQGTVERAVLAQAAAWFRVRSNVLAESFRRVWEYVIGWGVASDRRIAGPPGDWREVTWRPPRAADVDTGRNSGALLNELAAGVRTYQSVLGELGEDWRHALRQKADEVLYVRRLAEERGLKPEEIAAAALPSATQPSLTALQEDAEDEIDLLTES